MTREEAIRELKEDIELYIPLRGTIDDVDRDLPDGRLITALEMAIKALKQEPCEDAISRSDMLDAIGHGTTYTSEELQEIIKGMPPVNPQEPKTGQWIPQEMETYIDGKLKHWKAYKCNKCDNLLTDDYEYCPHCGAKMVEPQESEE